MSQDKQDAGTDGWVKRIGQLSVITAFITLFSLVITWNRTDMKELLNKTLEQNQSFITSLNTTNHLSAGAVNIMDKMNDNVTALMLEIKMLREEVRNLKLARVHTNEPPKADTVPPK